MAGTHNHHRPHPLPQPDLPRDPQEISQDLLGRFLSPRPGLRGALVGLFVLTVLGGVGLVLRLGTAPLSPEGRAGWAYLAVAWSYILSTAQAVPVFAVAMRLARNHWRRPLSRIAELYGVAGLLNLLILLLLLATLPAGGAFRRTLWQYLLGSPHVWDFLYMLALVLLGLALLYVSALPDLALVRDHGRGVARSLAGSLAGFWRGTPRQWRVLHMALGVLGAFYFIAYVMAHSLLAVDLAMVLVPGWKDAIFPAYQTLTSLQSAVALVAVTAFLYRRWGRMERYIGVEQFWALSKLLLATTLLWFYFWFAGFITFWYGRTPAEQGVIRLFIAGPYFGVFLLAFLFGFLFPFLLLIWNVVRRSVGGPVLASALVLFGNLMERVRTYAGAWSVPNEAIGAHRLEEIPHALAPGLPDVLMAVGALAGALFLVLLASRLVPLISVWEVKEWAMLQRVKVLVRRPVVVIAKPE